MKSIRSWKSAAAWLLLPLLALCIQAPSAAPKSDLWERWTAHDQGSSARIDHGPWNEFLGRYVETSADGINRVRYAGVSQADRKTLEAYISRLSELLISGYGRNSQRAYWINLYNALTIYLILEHYPVDSIKDIDISPGLFSSGPWDKKLVRIEGERLSLNDIEHRILRPIWNDPRIHYAVNCASLGCPNLMRTAFTADNTERLLNRGARAYVNHPRGVNLNGGKPVVSSIYSWFEEDFGNSDQGVLDHLGRYAEPDLRRKLARFEKIGGSEYDWRLNGVSAGN